MRRITGSKAVKLSIISIVLAVTGCGSGEPAGTTVPGMELPASSELLVLGDWGSGTGNQEEVAAAMAEHASGREIAAILTTGDNFYTNEVDQLMEPFTWATDEDIPFLVSWGNHDVGNPERIRLVEEAFAGAPRWVVHEWGDVDIVILDSTQIESRPQMGFLTQALAESDDPTIVVFHHPPYSCGSHGDTLEIQDQWVSRFDDDVFLVLNGHEHNYQRFEDEGITYVVTGGGGRFLTEMAECSPDHVARVTGEETHHFVSMRLAEGLDLTVIDADGSVIDRFSLTLP